MGTAYGGTSVITNQHCSAICLTETMPKNMPGVKVKTKISSFKTNETPDFSGAKKQE